ncbi:MAG: squalene-hopene/tetraprenyl-beta-curcumene cyclase [Solirubrobacteraceae bacterium]|jgi:squalene-hopene/tetraprenyl-beta-curcumene cyclase|nr:squalene-hopene/tetraprenyl-beta-curcumene cyclase [Solirubrobacteraceae bacterium]
MAVAAVDPEAVAGAMEKARLVLWASQRPDGSWESPGDMGPVPTAQVLVALHHAGCLEPGDAAAGARWLRRRQAADGSFVAYPSAPRGDAGATACVWAALHVAAPEESAEAIAGARAFVEDHGGLPAVVGLLDAGDLAAVYLALAGLLDPRALPCPPMAPTLIAPLVRWTQRRFHSGILMASMMLGVLARRLRGDWPPEGPPDGEVARRFCARTLTLLGTFHNPDGSVNANTVQTALALPALRAAGLAPEHPMVARTITWLQAQRVYDEEGMHVDVFGSAVWCTAFNLRALFAGGASPADPAAMRGLDWLRDSQSALPQPEVDNRNPGAPRTGGWAFQRGNETMVDCDDTGVVLGALGDALASGGLADPAAERVAASLARGRAWLLGMQNPDGGWSAFVWGLPGKPPGPMMTETVTVSMGDPVAVARMLRRPPPELGEPSTEDLTGRVLDGLGRTGMTASELPIRRAIDFLRVQQCDNGAFWGRWTVNYLAGTAYALMGLAAVGADLSAPWVRRAVGFLLAHQNDDGGWGELPDSYRDPGRAGVGPSMPPLTGIVLTALIDAGERESPAVAAGVAYLVGEQRDDGTWSNADYLCANVPPDTFYVLAEGARHNPTEALGRYLRPHRPGLSSS